MNIKKLIPGSLRFLAIAVTPTVLLGGFAVSRVYDSYWNSTIYRVQTVDFNLLSHSLPTKLSYVLYYRDFDEIQQTLDSTFGHFGLVMTNADGTQITQMSGGLKPTPDMQPWKAEILKNPKSLNQHPFDYLTYPPPIKRQYFYANERTDQRNIANSVDKNTIIGRVYYVRGIPPSFSSELLKWLSNPFSESSQIQQYKVVFILVFLGFVVVWLIFEFVLYKNHISEHKISKNLEEERRKAILLNKQRDDLRQNIDRLNREQELLRELAQNGRNVTEELELTKQEIAALRQVLDQVNTLKDLANNQLDKDQHQAVVVNWFETTTNDLLPQQFNRGELQIKRWLEGYGVTIHPKFRKKEIPPEFKRISKFMGEKYDLISNLYGQIKQRLNSGKGFRFRFNSRESTPERSAYLSFADLLHNAGFVEKKYVAKENCINFKRITTDSHVIGLLSGTWLELYITHKTVAYLNKLNSNGIYYTLINNLNIYLPDQQEAEFDLILMIEYGTVNKYRVPVIIECKTGEFRIALEKYSKIAKVLKLSAEQIIFVIAEKLNSTNQLELEKRHSLTITHFNNFYTSLDKLMSKVQSEQG